MKKYFIAFLFFYSIFHALFLWINAISDTYFYWAFAQFLKTGSYPFIHPFLYTKPTTISPPLYSILLLGIEYIKLGGFTLHVLQIATAIGTALFLYKVLSHFFSINIATSAAILFLFIPGNVIFISYVLTEIGAQFLVMLYAYLLFEYVRTHHGNYLALSAPLGFIMGLWKYSLILYGLVSIILLVIHKPHKIISFIPSAIGISIVFVWILFNHQITGVWGLSDSNAVQLYNQIVWMGKTLPSEQNVALIKLREYIPRNVSLYQSYWDLEDYILPKVGHDWTAMSNIFGNVAYAAVREHPIAYLQTTAQLFFRTHGPGRPYWDNLAVLNIKRPVFCGTLGTYKFCKSILYHKYLTSELWKIYIRWSDFFYEIPFPFISLFIFLPSLFYSLIRGDAYMKLFGILHLVGTIPVAMYVQFDTRYLLPFYPLMVLCIMLTMRKINRDYIKRYHQG